MRAKNYINGLVALLLCTACNNEELPQPDNRTDEIMFGGMLQTSTDINARGIGNNQKDTEALPYIYGIHVRKMENPNPFNSEYHVKDGNKGTLVLENSSTALTWTANEKSEDTNIHFYAWTEPDGVTIDKDAATGTIDFGDTNGNRAPKDKDNGEKDKHKMNETYYTPLELFISAHATGSYKNNPTISLPFTHLVGKVGIQIYNWNTELISEQGDVTIEFPFINQTWNIEQKQTDGGDAFKVTTPNADITAPLRLTMSNLHCIGDKENKRRIFYLPPMVGDYDFAHAGDFVITYKKEKYYGTLNDLALTNKSLAAGEYLKCRIDLNKDYGTGVGATISEWTFAKETEAPANPYQGIYTKEELDILSAYLADVNPKKEELSKSLYIKGENDEKIIRLYNDLTLTGNFSSLVLEKNMIFDGLGHTITVPTGESLFGGITATGVEINNIRLAGAGQLASSLENVTVYNCHANETGNLVGTANNGTTFNFCSAETASSLLADKTNGTVTMTNCFVAYAGAAGFAGSGQTVTAKNSFFFDTKEKKGTYYDKDGKKASNDITVDTNNKLEIITDNSTKPVTALKLIDLLNEGSKDSGNTWVYVYDKSYPVMRIK